MEKNPASESLILILDDNVIPRTAVQDINSWTSDQDVVAEPSKQSIISTTANEDIVIGAAIDDQSDQARWQGRGVHEIESGKCVHDDPIDRGFAPGDCQRG